MLADNVFHRIGILENLRPSDGFGTLAASGGGDESRGRAGPHGDDAPRRRGAARARRRPRPSCSPIVPSANRAFAINSKNV